MKEDLEMFRAQAQAELNRLEAQSTAKEITDKRAALDKKQKEHLHKLIASIKALHLRDPQNPNPTVEEKPATRAGSQIR